MKKILILKKEKKKIEPRFRNLDKHRSSPNDFQKFHQYKLKLISTNPNQNSVNSSICHPYAPLWLTRSLTHRELHFTCPFASIAYMIHTLILNFFDFLLYSCTFLANKQNTQQQSNLKN